MSGAATSSPLSASRRWGWGTGGGRSCAHPGAGSIGLHSRATREAASRPSGEAGSRDIALVRLGFSTSEDLDELAARLRAAGYEARRVDQQGVSSVQMTDPDGQHLEVHARVPG